MEGRGSETASLMILADSPSRNDDRLGSVLSSQAARLLDNILFENIGARYEDVYKTYTVKCFAGDEKVKEKHVKACSEYLQEEILRIKPKVILTLGELSMNTLTGLSKISAQRGKVIAVDYHGLKLTVVPTYSPFYIANAMTHLETFALDIDKAHDLSQGVKMQKAETKVTYCDTIAKVEQAIDYCVQVGVCSFDFETTDIDKEMETFHPDHKGTTISLSFQHGSAYVIPLEHKDSPFDSKDISTIMSMLGERIFSNPEIRKVGHNIDFDCHMLRIYGITDFRGRYDDTMLMHHLYDETLRHGLKGIVAQYLPEFAGYDDELAQYRSWSDIPLPLLCQYNGTDTDMTLRMCTLLESYLQQDPPVYIIYRNLTMAVFKSLWGAEKDGMLIDRDYLRQAVADADRLIELNTKSLLDHRIVKRYIAHSKNKAQMQAIAEQEAKLKEASDRADMSYLSARDKSIQTLADRLCKYEAKEKRNTEKEYELATKIAELSRETVDKRPKSAAEQKILEKLSDLKAGRVVAYEGLNFGSVPQLSDLLYTSEAGFKFKVLDQATGKDVLEQLRDSTGFVDKLLVYRSLGKINGTYLKGILRRLDDNDRVRSTYKLNGTVSGRASSSNPNLQNLPSVAKLKDDATIQVVNSVKKSFIVPEGYTLLAVDFSQAELRTIASFAGEETMLQAYRDGIDLHALTASNVLRISLEEFYKLDKDIQKQYRSRAKAINFGFIYGMSANGFKDYARSSYKVELTLEEAVEYRNIFFSTYPKLLDYHQKYVAKGVQHGWVRTLFGRRRRLPDITSDDDFKRGLDERVAVNSPIQGTSGELTLFAIALLRNRLHHEVIFVNTIHDSIMYYVPDSLLESTAKLVKQTCENLPTMQYFAKELNGVSMKVDIETSKVSWKDLEPYEIQIT